MRHLIRKNRKKTFLWNLGNNLILKERIKTTEARAKEIRSLIEKVVSTAKNETLANRRLLLKSLTVKTVNKLFKELAPRFKERHGGYLRISKVGIRKNDGAKMAIIEFIK